MMDKRVLFIKRVNLGEGYLSKKKQIKLKGILRVDTIEPIGYNNLSLINYNNLTALILSNNQLSDEGIIHLSEMLKTNKSLKKIAIRHNSIECIRAKYIADALKVNTTLKYVDLSDNRIYSDGITHILDALKINKSLFMIDLRDNSYYSFNNYRCIANVIRINPTLRKLYLDINQRMHDISTIKEALCYNKMLIELHSDPNLLPYLKRNRLIRDTNLTISYFLLGIRNGTNREGMGLIGWLPKDVLRMIIIMTI